MMTASNLAIVFAPNLMQPDPNDKKRAQGSMMDLQTTIGAMKLLIINSKSLFQNNTVPESLPDCLGPVLESISSLDINVGKSSASSEIDPKPAPRNYVSTSSPAHVVEGLEVDDIKFAIDNSSHSVSDSSMQKDGGGEETRMPSNV